MIFNIILVVLFVVQTVLLLTMTIIRNHEIVKEINLFDELFNELFKEVEK